MCAQITAPPPSLPTTELASHTTTSLLPAAAMTFFGNKNSKLKIGFLYISQGVGALLQVKANILSTFLIAHAMVGVVITCGSSKCYVKLQIYILGNCENAIQKRLFQNTYM